MRTIIWIVIAVAIVSCGPQMDKEVTKAPPKLSKEKKFELSEKCARLGKAYFQDFRTGAMYSALATKSKYLWDDPEYHYSERLNTCLIHIRYMEFDSYHINISRHYNQIVDIFSNKTLLRGWFRRDVENNKEEIVNLGDDVLNYTSIGYFKRKDQLFAD